MNTDIVLGYRRPAMLGGPGSPDPDALTVRWYGTSNFELNFHDRVVLLDTFPAASTIQPVYVEPVTIGMKSQLITVGDPRP